MMMISGYDGERHVRDLTPGDSRGLQGSLVSRIPMAYSPTCCEDAFKNHADAFSAQDEEKIMLDYTEESVILVWNWSAGSMDEKKGRDQIREMFKGFWSGMAPDGWGPMEASVQECRSLPAGGGTGFYVWNAPENNIPRATDTFIFDKDFKIVHQTFAGQVG